MLGIKSVYSTLCNAINATILIFVMVNTPFFAEYQIVENRGGETPPLRMAIYDKRVGRPHPYGDEGFMRW